MVATFLQLRLNRDGHITGTEYLSDLVEKEHADHKHGNCIWKSFLFLVAAALKLTTLFLVTLLSLIVVI